MMKISSWLILLLALSVQSRIAHADRYVSEAGTSSTCPDWANACNEISQALAVVSRGETVWVADGIYQGVTLDHPNDSSKVISLVKATSTRHGTETGWRSDFGDGRALINGDVSIATDYWVLDGSQRNENLWNDGPSYGMKVQAVATNYFFFGHAADHVTLRYLDIGNDYGDQNQSHYGDGIYLGGFAETVEHWLVQRSYIHNVRAAAQHAGVDHVTYEYNFIGPNFQKTGIRHQVRGSNTTYRYNIFKNACQGDPNDPSATSCTAIIGWYGNAGSINEDYSHSKVYGNLFWDTKGTVFYSDACLWMGDDRTSQGGGKQNCTGCAIYNNTFSGPGAKSDSGTCSLKFEGLRDGTEAVNNLWHNTGKAILGCQATHCASNFVASSGAIFRDSANGDFALLADGAGGEGTSLPSPYAVDVLGVARGLGTWDVGAFEFGIATGLRAPTNLRLTP